VQLPGAVVESANTGVNEPKIGKNLSASVTTDTSRITDVGPDLEEWPPKESQPFVEESQPGVNETQSGVVKAHKGPQEGETTVVETKQVVVTERRLILTEIEKSKLLRDELMRQDPSLATVASFLSTVCGRLTEESTGKDRDDDKIKTTESKGAPSLGLSQPRTDAKYIERQRLTQITAAKSFLEEKLRKKRPSLESIATFRAAAYGDDSTPELVTVEKDLATGNEMTTLVDGASTRTLENRTGEPSETTNPATISTAVVESEIVKSTEVTLKSVAESEVIISDDAAMSVGDSDEEEESDGFSRSGNSSSRGESIPSRGSRKRPADESPEREITETVRKEFPGLVSRSEAGCRIYIPTPQRAGAMEVITQLMTTPIAVPELQVPRMTDEKNTTELEQKMCDASTRNAAGITEGENATGTPARVVDQEATSVVVPVDSTCVVTKKGMVGPADSIRAGAEVNVEDIGGLHTLERPQAPIFSASAICSLTTIEPVVSEYGEGNSVMSDVGPPPLPAEGWARDAQMVEGIFRIMEGMEPPWITLDVLEAATVRFPTIDREMLRRTIMTVMMTQRRCVVRLTRAQLRRGACTDRDGNSFVELDLDFADRYSMSH